MYIQNSTRGTGDDVVVVFKTKLDLGCKTKLDPDFFKKSSIVDLPGQHFS